MRVLKHAHGELPLDRCLVMGIVNRTPDSFYESAPTLDGAIEQAVRLVEEGADILDVGAVKAGPGIGVTEKEEADRLLPLIEALVGNVIVPISVETSRPGIARRAFAAGAAMLNDVTGLVDIRSAEVCAEAGATLIVMHNGGQVRGRPRTPRYDDVVADVASFLDRQAERALTAGVAAESLVVDPGLDFGKTTFQSLEVVRRLDELVARRRPVLVAHSRKDLVGETLGQPPDGRLAGSLAVAALAVMKGASILRAHDVADTVSVVGMVEAVLGRRPPAAPVRGLWD